MLTLQTFTIFLWVKIKSNQTNKCILKQATTRVKVQNTDEAIELLENTQLKNRNKIKISQVELSYDRLIILSLLISHAKIC